MTLSAWGVRLVELQDDNFGVSVAHNLTVGDLYHVSVNKAQFTRAGAVEVDATVPLGWGPLFRGEAHDLRVRQTVRFRKF